MPSVSVLVVARNAESTVGEAIASALSEGVDEVVLVDDASTDGTVAVASSLSDERLKIVQLAEHRTLGYARQVGLESISGDFCFLLDADDAFLPGRIERLSVVLLDEDTDFVADELELVDGASGCFMRRLGIPDFLDAPPGLARLFERNYLPGIGQIGFRVKTMRRIGYDVALHGVEDSDLVLRALLSGARGSCVREVGYRMRHFPGSVSRNRFRQASELCSALRKHDPDAVWRLLLDQGMDARGSEWALFGFFVFRREYGRASSILSRIERDCEGRVDILEPTGPYPYPEGWRIDFARGTLALLEGEDSLEALHRLKRAADVLRLPECLNNFGVARYRSGESARAIALWEEAGALMPGYADARENLSLEISAKRLTTLPLRRDASRSEY